MMRLVRMGGLSALATMVFLAWIGLSPGPTLAEETQPLSLAEMEDAFIAAVEADGDKALEFGYKRYEKPHYIDAMTQRLGCFRSDASGNFDRGWTLRDDFGRLQSVSLRAYAYQNRFIVFHGYRYRSADEQSALIVDRLSRRVVPVMLHYFDWNRVSGRRSDHQSDGIVSAFLPPDLSPAVIADLDRVIADWIVGVRSDGREVCKAEGSCTPRYYAFTCE